MKYDVSDYYISKIFKKKQFLTLAKKQFIINAKYEGKIISSIIFLEHGDYLHYFLVANDPNFYSLNANSLIMYEAACYAKNKGTKQFHLGGAGSEELSSYKSQFTRMGGCAFYIGKKARNEEIYNKTVKLKLEEGNIINQSYFPLYNRDLIYEKK